MTIGSNEIGKYAEGCFRDSPPPCSSVCPLRLDLRGLIEKVQNEKWGSAFRLYRDTVLFPSVVSALCSAPCRDACVLGCGEGMAGDAIDLKRIEQGIVENSQRRDPVRYAVPKKSESIAVIGAGLSGLSCAWRLASKGYGVTVYEAESRIGGGVRTHSGLDAALDEDVTALFGFTDFDLRLDTPVNTALFEKLAESSDSVYVATGQGGAAFGFSVQGSFDARTLAAASSGVFLGGALVWHTEAARNVAFGIENGLRAAASIEEYLKTGRAAGIGKVFDRPDLDERFYALPLSADLHRTPKGAADEAVSEARRCPRCNCSACIDACTLIRWYKQNPKRIAADIEVTLLPVEGKIKRVASRFVNSCNLCGLCTAVCPSGVDTCAAIYTARRGLSAGGNLPAAFHDFWLEDLKFSMSEAAYAAVPPPSGSKAKLLFFPGCQLAASLPDIVAKTFAHIRARVPETALLLSCCGVPADWACEEEVFESVLARIRAELASLGNPAILFACATCKKTFEKYLPEAGGRLVYEWLSEQESCPAAASASQAEGAPAAYIFDPCSADAAGKRTVRGIAQALGFEPENVCASYDAAAACCGFGGHIYPAAVPLLEAVALERAAISEAPYITYCANCRDFFRHEGKRAAHILELFFSDDRAAAAGAGVEEAFAPETLWTGGLPSLSTRRENRRTLKRAVMGLSAEEAPILPDAPQGFSARRLEIPPAVTAKMDRLLLLHEEVEAAIAYCEAEGAKVYDPASGHFIGCARVRVTTVWVEYQVDENGGVTVFNVYTHRMEVEG